MAKIPGDGNTAPFPASDGTYDPSQISEDLGKRIDIPTIPDQPQNLPTRRGRTSEIVKEMFVWELRHYLDSVNSPDDLLPVPVVMKFASDLPNPYQELNPLETVLRIIRSYPDLTERLPYIGVVATGGKNNKLAMSGKYVGACLQSPRLVAGTGPFTPPIGPPIVVPPTPDLTAFNDNEVPGVPGVWPEPVGASKYGVNGGDWVEITTVVDGAINVERFQFSYQLLGVSPQSPRMIADVINYSALYCHADVVLYNGVPTLIVEPGGPLGKQGSYFEIFRSDASPNFDANINLPLTKLIAPSNQFPMQNRYVNSLDITIGLIIGTDADTIRTEITDLISNFFIFVMNTRQFTFWGRSFYSNTPDEYLQVLIKDSAVNIIGEQEIPRPDDPARYIYVNRIDVPITLLQYIDRPIQQGAMVVDYEYITPVHAPSTTQFAGIASFDAIRERRLAGIGVLNQSTSDRFPGFAQFDMQPAFAQTAELSPTAIFAQLAELEPYAIIAHDATLLGPAKLAHTATLEVVVVGNLIAGIGELDASAVDQLAHLSELEATVTDQLAHLSELDAASSIQVAHLSELEAGGVEQISQLSELETGSAEQVAHLSDLDATALEQISQVGSLEGTGTEQVAGEVILEGSGAEQVARISELEAINIEALAGFAELV